MANITQRGQLTKDDSGVAIGWQYANATATGATIVKTSPGVLHAITFNKPTATSVVSIFNNTTTGGTLIGTITVPANPQPVTLRYDVVFGTGLSLDMTTAVSDITISYI